MKIIDLHQDLMTHIRFKKQFNQEQQTSFSMIMDSALDVVVATAFPMPPDDNQYHSSVHNLITEELCMYQEFVSKNDDWSVLKNVSDFNGTTKKLLLHIEGLNIWKGTQSDWDQLDLWRELGVRSIGTHWNLENTLGGGTLQPDVRLTSLGVEVIAYLEENNFVFDMAHMGRQSFWDAQKITKRPLYVSHGNADVLCSNIRNYTDEQMSAIAQSGGLMGVFFPNTFVAGKGKMGTVADVVAHVQYMKKVMGIRHIAIGSDFGGIVTGTVEGLSSVDDLPSLVDLLDSAGLTSGEIDLVLYSNARRVLEAHLS